MLPTEEDACNASLIRREDLTNEISVVRVWPDSGQAPDFLPGQFIKLGLPRDRSDQDTDNQAVRQRSRPRLIRRAYSIASSPREKNHLEFLVVLVDTGKLTPKLWPIGTGGRLWMDDRVAGRFTLEPIPPDSEVIMVATGTGVAPYMSMLRTYAGERRWRRAVLIHGVRYAADLAYRGELEELDRTNSRFTYVPVVSREPRASGPGPSWAGLRGRVQRVLSGGVYKDIVGASLEPHRCHVMLCGNPNMIIEVQRMLKPHGFHTGSSSRPGNIHFERYW